MFVTHRRYKLSVPSAVVHATMVALCLVASAPRAHAQNEAGGNRVTREELEPLIIGRAGATLVGLAGFADRLLSSEETYSTIYTAHLDVVRFLTNRIAVRGGLAGTGPWRGVGEQVVPGHSGTRTVGADLQVGPAAAGPV